MVHLNFLGWNILTLAFTALAAWWLSGFDSRLTGDNRPEDFIRRAFRCGLTLLLVEAAFWGMWQWVEFTDRTAGWIFLVAALPLAFIWSGCFSELFAIGFQRLIDPQYDATGFSPDQAGQDLDVVAGLIRSGRKEEAIELCEKLKKSGDANILAVETMLEHLGVQQDHGRKPAPLTEASLLRSQGKFPESEALLNSLLKKDPSDIPAAFMLMRLYAENLRQRDRAEQTLDRIVKKARVSPAFIEYAHRSIEAWINAVHPPEKSESAVESNPKSVDELLAAGQFGTAVERLEQEIEELPQDFELWMKYAEVHGRHCGNLKRAEKIIQKIETNPAFDPQQIQHARSRLNEWRERP